MRQPIYDINCNLRSEVGWYIYGLCNSLTDIVLAVFSPSPHSSDTTEAAQVLFLCGKLAGSVKKWNRGDQSWDNFQPRIQKNVSDLLGLLRHISPVPLEVAMKKNIEKIQSRRERKVVLGDGSGRWSVYLTLVILTDVALSFLQLISSYSSNTNIENKYLIKTGNILSENV